MSFYFLNLMYKITTNQSIVSIPDIRKKDVININSYIKHQDNKYWFEIYDQRTPGIIIPNIILVFKSKDNILEVQKKHFYEDQKDRKFLIDKDDIINFNEDIFVLTHGRDLIDQNILEDFDKDTQDFVLDNILKYLE